MRDIDKCKTMRAAEYMTPAQQEALLETWSAQDYVLRDEISAPDWAHFVDRDGTAYSIEYLAEEWLRWGAEEGKISQREMMLALAPVMTMHMITASLMERVEEGELRAVVDSPDEWN